MTLPANSFDLPACYGPALDRMPWALRILAENVARTGSGSRREDAVTALRAWDGHPDGSTELDLVPVRLLMHDTTSTPALVDIAAMRDALAEAGGDPELLGPALRVDVSIDHSAAVEAYATRDALRQNLQHEMRRNAERFSFLKWASNAMEPVHLNPPGTGIMHTINLEQLASVVTTVTDAEGQEWTCPDFMLGTDSHTPMVNGVGVLGWGVGGLEAEMVMLGLPCTISVPDVVGVHLRGELADGVTATDLALVLTHALRRLGVTGSFVEFHGPGVSTLSVGQRAVVANMAPEYGATTGYFPIDERTVEYLRLVAPHRVDASLVEQYCRANHLWFDPTARPQYSRVLELDLADVPRTVAGPRRPQDALQPGELPATLPDDDRPATDLGLPRRPVALAAITSCTNTTDPGLLVAAGLVARKARERGLATQPWVKTSLAPGSPAAQRYLRRSGLLDDLEALGFDIVAFGCTTCIGNSGPLPEPIASLAAAQEVTPVAILSGNRNFPGRVNPDVELSFIMSPPMVVAFALLGDAGRDVTTAVLGRDQDGNEVRLADLWPSRDEIDGVLQAALQSEDFPGAFEQARSSQDWRRLPSSTAPTYPWDPGSTILRRPPFASATVGTRLGHYEAAPLLVLGDDVTTDHISPASAIPADSPVADFLVERGEDRGDLNVFASRRGNWEVMARGAYYNKALENQLVADDAPTGTTRHAGGELLTIWDAAQRYEQAGTPTVVVAGDRYGMGSSRDWAAKAQWLLGVHAVLAAGYERIHRSNLIGMGILPLVLPAEQREALGQLDATTTFVIDADPDRIRPHGEVGVTVRHSDGREQRLVLRAAIETEQEVTLLRDGGAIPHILQRTLATPAAGGGPAHDDSTHHDIRSMA